MCAPLIMEQDTDIVGAALECLYNLSCHGGDTVHHLVSQDILTPLCYSLHHLCALIGCYLEILTHYWLVALC